MLQKPGFPIIMRGHFLHRVETTLFLKKATPPAKFAYPTAEFSPASPRLSQKLKGARIAPSPCCSFISSRILAPEKPLPIQAVLQSGDPEQGQNAEVAENDFRRDGTKRKQKCGRDDDARDDREDEFVLHDVFFRFVSGT